MVFWGYEDRRKMRGNYPYAKNWTDAKCVEILCTLIYHTGKLEYTKKIFKRRKTFYTKLRSFIIDVYKISKAALLVLFIPSVLFINFSDNLICI